MRRFCKVSRADGLNDVLNEAAGSRGDPGHPYMDKEAGELARTKVEDEVLGQLPTTWRR
jgi:hypothetical protein